MWMRRLIPALLPVLMVRPARESAAPLVVESGWNGLEVAQGFYAMEAAEGLSVGAEQIQGFYGLEAIQ